MNRKESKHGARFYTQRDMAIIKADAEILAAQRKRGEIPPAKALEYIAACGCGAEGCFIHSSYDPNK
jgi:hypothetical protein